MGPPQGAACVCLWLGAHCIVCVLGLEIHCIVRLGCVCFLCVYYTSRWFENVCVQESPSQVNIHSQEIQHQSDSSQGEVIALGSPGGPVVESQPPVQEPACGRQSGSICGPEAPLEKEMAVYSSILAWEISWTKEPGGLQTVGSKTQT